MFDLSNSKQIILIEITLFIKIYGYLHFMSVAKSTAFIYFPVITYSLNFTSLIISSTWMNE